jgi:ankyrin repeat protein
LSAIAGAEEASYCLSRALDFGGEPAALLFLEHGADATLRIDHHQQRTHLHKAVINRRSEGTVRALLERGADPNLPDEEGLILYRYAVRLGYPELVALLESFDADTAQATDQDRA